MEMCDGSWGFRLEVLDSGENGLVDLDLFERDGLI